MMRRHLLLKTDLTVCLIILAGFVLTSVISYTSNMRIFEKDAEHVSWLTSECIYHKIDAIFTKPVNVSLTMANDSLLKGFLSEEAQRLEDDSFLDAMRGYLNAYRKKYAYDSVFLVSARTNRYYHFNGLDRVLQEGEPENVWYYEFLKSGAEYALNIDNDEAADNEITIFINCKIFGASGETMGVVGVGFRVDSLQALLREYEQRFGVSAWLVDGDGNIVISSEYTGYQAANLFDDERYQALEGRILMDHDESEALWFNPPADKGYMLTQYVPQLDWFLLIDYDLSALHSKLTDQLARGVAVVAVVVALVLVTITGIIRRYKSRIVELSVARELEHRAVFQTETAKLYENIYEVDITHNRTASDATDRYFESMGVPASTPYDQALPMIAERNVQAQFREGYLETFRRENVLKTYEEGGDSLCYEFRTLGGDGDYYWMRVTARIFRWEEDGSIRMFIYRQDIDEQKRQEASLLERMRQDSLTGLCNKDYTQKCIKRRLGEQAGQRYAFFIVDIDDFKRINDTHGHAVGDKVIVDFAARLKAQFAAEDIVGRIGGDEFVAFCAVPSRERADEMARVLSAALRCDFGADGIVCAVSASIGVALSPEAGQRFEALYKNADIALYRAKARGKNGYALFEADS